MSEIQKTMGVTIVAVLLALLAILTAPARVMPDTFLDQGEPFFPEFTDPNTATTLEVVEYEEETGTTRPFKVTFQNRQWTIPSHHNYPADGQDRLAQTAAGLIGIKKDDYRSNNVADHEALGVIDPLDETATTFRGRGKRITVRGANQQILGDLIIGNSAEGRSNLRFVRLPDQKRVYASLVNVDISTKFEDWIEQDLLQVETRTIQNITLRDYSIDERTRSINQRDVLTLSRSEETWEANRMPSDQEVDSTKIDELLEGIDELSIVGVRPKPEGLSKTLARAEGANMSQAEALSLQSRGYYFTRDGNLVSNEGEMEVQTSEGVVYLLRFGEVLYGSGQAITAGGNGGSDDNGNTAGENRYLFITASFEPELLPEPSESKNTEFLDKSEEEWTDSDRNNNQLHTAHKQWQEKVTAGQKRAEELDRHFAAWYYVISSESFAKIQLRRNDLVKDKESKKL